MDWLLAFLIWAVISMFAGVVYAYVMTRYNTMRTASHRQIERETAAIRRNGSSAPARPPVVENTTVRSLCKQRARQHARHAARVEEIYGMPAVNPYRSSDPEYVEWAIGLAEMHTEIAHAKSPVNQFNHRGNL